MWAKDIDEARSKVRDIIAQNSLQFRCYQVGEK